MNFDLAPQLDTVSTSEAGVWLSLRTLTGAPLRNGAGQPVRVRVLGPDSRTYREAMRELVRARLTSREAPTVRDEDEMQIDTLARLTTAWEGVTSGGEPVGFSHDAARAFYTAFPAIREQVDTFAGSRANFLPPASKALSPTGDGTSDVSAAPPTETPSQTM